ncbi:sigma-54-dependent transcriptional regulator [Crocinitomix catalasitica]|uniref:sigma-54-dependent transcriptional regulator n=1 Tax=Crocinitomix catalasitica TaxID=184607 RepID=UPI000484F370|nr:sigma-54 dependent transcriptional regulator [Crocinitomix catalasitica]
MSDYRIVIIEDDRWYAEVLKHHLELNPEYLVKWYEDGLTFLNKVKIEPNLICLDYSMPGLKGDEMLSKIKAKFPNTEVIIISGQEDVATAVLLLKLGAYDYIIKDEDTTTRLWNTVLKVKEKDALKSELKTLKAEVQSKFAPKNAFIGESAEMQSVFKMIEKAANADITVSITGETGTGKEVVAKSIHYNSPKKDKPFVAVNVTAIPRDLVESELFGHEKGAFTGAATRRIGKFEEANNGTLFLDEIGEMDLNMQAKLLRALQEKEIIRVGGTQKVKLNLRVVVATHKNLLQEVKAGNFRQDLYYRLLGLPIELPPLRDRGKDIVLIAEFFLEDFCKKNGKPIQKLSPSAEKKLLAYSFPGNVRELKALIELSSVMTEGDVIDATDIMLHTSGGDLGDLLDVERTLKDYTNKIVQHYLNKFNGNVIKAAAALDVGKSTIYRMIQANEIKA